MQIAPRGWICTYIYIYIYVYIGGYVEGEETRSVPVLPRGFGNAAQKSCRGIEVAYKVSLKTRCT